MKTNIFDFDIYPVGECYSINPDEGQKKLLITAQEPETPELKEFLNKMLLAIHLKPEEDTLLLWNTPGATSIHFARFLNRTGISSAIFFGKKPQQAGFIIEYVPYKPVHFYGKRLLFCDPLSKIVLNQPAKRLLWEALKEMFLNPRV